MAYLVKRTVTRPNTSVAFFSKSAGYDSGLNAEKSAGNLLSSSETTSDNGLTLVTTALWANKAAHDSFSANSSIQEFWQLRKDYHAANGITVVISKTEI